MTKYEELIQLMEKKGTIRALKVAKQFTPEIPGFPAEAQKEIDKACLAKSIGTTMGIDPEIRDAFSAAATEMMINRLFEDLDLKKDPNFKATPAEEFAKTLAFGLFGDLLKNLH